MSEIQNIRQDGLTKGDESGMPRHGSAPVARLELYDLHLKADRSADRLVQSGDTVHVGPVFIPAAVIGSVNRLAAVELIASECIEQALAITGGSSSVAGDMRLTIKRLAAHTSRQLTELAMPRDALPPPNHDDVVREFSAPVVVQSTQNENKRMRMRIDVEVQRPGESVMRSGSTPQDSINAAGDLAPTVFLYEIHFMRDSVRATQQKNFAHALRDLETDLARSSGTHRASSAEQIGQFPKPETAKECLMERLRALRPNGRGVLRLGPGAMQALEVPNKNGDYLFAPGIPSTGVFGSVFNTGSNLYGKACALEEYLRLSTGPTKGGDEDSIFADQSHGWAVSSQQSGDRGRFICSAELGKLNAEPSDTTYVTENVDETALIQDSKDWIEILFQLGIGNSGTRIATQCMTRLPT